MSEGEPGTDDAVAALRAELLGTVEKIERRVDSLRAPAAPPAPVAAAEPAKPEPEPLKTPSELQELVDAGTLTQAAMSQILARQEAKRAAAEAVEQVRTETATETRFAKVDAQIGLYTESHPEAMVEGSPERQRLVKEFTELVSLGYPNDKTTELLALRTTFGEPTAKVKELTPRPSEVEAGGGDGEPETPDKQDGAPSGLSPRLRSHYAGMIEKSYYTGWDDPKLKRELDFANRKKAS